MGTDCLSLCTCMIKFQESGNSKETYSVEFIPDQVREMAAFVVDECVVGDGAGGDGGYVTRQIANTGDYFEDPTNGLDFTYGFREFACDAPIQSFVLKLVQLRSEKHHFLQSLHLEHSTRLQLFQSESTFSMWLVPHIRRTSWLRILS